MRDLFLSCDEGGEFGDLAVGRLSPKVAHKRDIARADFVEHRAAVFRVACAAAKISNIDVKNRRAVFYKVGSRDVAFVRDLKGKTPDRKIAELAAFVS